MQSNIDRYMGSQNEYVRNEYNSIRLNIALTLQAVFGIGSQESPTARQRRLERMRMSLEEQDTVRNGTLDKLIREHRINSDMATSLMNDTAYAYEIQSNLISAFESVQAGLLPLREELELSEEELDKQLILKREEILDRLRKEEARIDAITGRNAQH